LAVVAALWVVTTGGCASPPPVGSALGGTVGNEAGSAGIMTNDGSTGTMGGNDATAGEDANGAGGDANGVGDDATSEGAAATTWGPGDVTPSTPIMAPNGVWTDVPFPDGFCRDGEPAHMMVHLNSASQKIAIYEDAGGVCFNDATCIVGNLGFPGFKAGQGIFNFSNTDNPIADWNVFYIPDCEADTHAGDNHAGVPGPLTGPQHFSGYTNVKLYLARILATVPNMTDVLLTGSSAGGFGAALETDLIGRNLPASVQRYTMIDDSGPPLPNPTVPTCLQNTWQTVWGFGNTVLKDCGSGCPDHTNWTSDYLNFIAKKYGTGPMAQKFMGGFISSTADPVISAFFGFGKNNCTGVGLVSAADYQAGLLAIRRQVTSLTDRFGTFYFTSTTHTTLLFDTGVAYLGGLYSTQVAADGGTAKLTDWIRGLLNHTQAAHVGP
jgi:hypothetical protein